MKTVIVGGVAGGASAAARLRRLDESAEIVMFERGEYISFANCGLPYYIGGEIVKKSALTLQTPQSFRSRFNVDVRVNSEVTAIDRAAKTVTVNSKERGEYTESYDKLILSPERLLSSPTWKGRTWTGCSPCATSRTPLKLRNMWKRNSQAAPWWSAEGTSAWKWLKT